ncbi:hypothetical protein F5Y04DRAFT_84635 [Hypomontagnella monticulosa]|nr:hypothetical protein F5Y04DRAFT_84635 [Hypomontagnella monticulosa]
MATRTPTDLLQTPTTQGLYKLEDDDCDRNLQKDSGYSTSFQTPDQNASPEESGRSSSNTVGKIINQVRLVLSGTGLSRSLAEFDKPLDEDTISRFSHIQSQIEKPLLEYVGRFPGKPCRMAIRLMVLGASESDAKPYIVVLVPDNLCKRVKKFFAKSSVRELCQPDSETTPSFEIMVYGRPPELKEGSDDINVLGLLVNGNLGFTSNTYCGTPILVRHPSGMERRATFGGIIKLVSQSGDFKLYGLTVRHVVGYMDDNPSTPSAADAETSPPSRCISDLDLDSDSDSDMDMDAYEAYDGNEKSMGDIQIVNKLEDTPVLQDDDLRSWSSLEFGQLGIILKESSQLFYGGGKDREWVPDENLDWALIDVTDYKPNRIPLERGGKDMSSSIHSAASSDLAMTPPSPNYMGMKKSVIIISGSEGPKRGHISALPSRLLLHPGKKFVSSLVVNLEDNKQLSDGDSGSWVVDERTLQVYGHVVAADDFGSGYIIPLDKVFEDIKFRLNMNSVQLASMLDIASARMANQGINSSINTTEYSLPFPLPTLPEIPTQPRPYELSMTTIPYSPPPSRPTSGAWTVKDDQNLISARQKGLNWAQIQSVHFPHKSPMACRKRHERLFEHKDTSDWENRKLERLANEYMKMRKEIWQPLAQQVGEKWMVVEAKCMNNGLKNLQAAARSATRRERLESGQPLPLKDDDDGDSGIYDINPSPMDISRHLRSVESASDYHYDDSLTHHKHIKFSGSSTYSDNSGTSASTSTSYLSHTHSNQSSSSYSGMSNNQTLHVVTDMNTGAPFKQSAYGSQGTEALYEGNQ